MLVAGPHSLRRSPFRVLKLQVVLRSMSVIRSLHGGMSIFFSFHRTSNPCRRIYSCPYAHLSQSCLFGSFASKMLYLFFATLASMLWHFHNECCQEAFVDL